MSFTMAPGGVKTSILQNTIVLESADVDILFGIPGMGILKLAVVTSKYS